MNKPASELIALADELNNYAIKYSGDWASASPTLPWSKLALIIDTLRTAANQSGSERAGVDALREALVTARECIWSGGNTISTLKTIDTALATPPAQPAPAATHGKPDGVVREALSALVNAVSNMRVPQNVADAALQITIIGPVLERAKAALHSPKIAAAETSPGDAAEDLGRFGHHPDPAIDFCIEVECLENEWTNIKANFTNGTPSREEIESRVFRAMQFRVGGDTGATDAKAALRKVEQEMRSSAIDRLDVNAADAVAWRCFHCGFTAKTELEAINHFGKTMDFQSACQGEGGQWAQRLRRHVRSLLNGIETGAVKIETDQDETLARDLSFMRFAVDHYEAQKPTTKPEAPAVSVDALAEIIKDKIEVDIDFEYADATINAVPAATAIAALIAGDR